MHELIHKELSESIIGAAMTGLNFLKPGLDEKLYERALVIELEKRGHKVESQRQFPVYYDGQLIGTLVPDLLVHELVIVDPKVVSAFNESHQAQMIGYLAITNLRLALLLNFKSAKLDWKRVVRRHSNLTTDHTENTNEKAGDGPQTDLSSQGRNYLSYPCPPCDPWLKSL